MRDSGREEVVRGRRGIVLGVEGGQGLGGDAVGGAVDGVHDRDRVGDAGVHGRGRATVRGGCECVHVCV